MYEKPKDDVLRERLTPLQYEVLVNGATERPFSSGYTDMRGDGIYVDAATGQPLFSSLDKFDSGCGWPSFSAPISEGGVRYKKDASHGMLRREVRSADGDLHLGHVFDDGPPARGGLRYCINGAALRFVPRENMREEGYADLLRLFDGEGGQV